METNPGADITAPEAKPEQEKDTKGPTTGPRLSGVDSDVALYDLRRRMASRSRSHRERRGNFDEAFRLLLHSAVSELPYRSERSLPSNWETRVRADFQY